MAEKIVAFYKSREQAELAKDQLEDAGFDDDDTRIFSQKGPSVWRDVKEAFGFADESDRHLYDEAARRGAVALLVDFDDEDSPSRQTAIDILQRNNPIDLDVESEQWRREGWSGHSAVASAGAGAATRQATPQRATGQTTQANAAAATTTSGEQVIPVVQENVEVGKRAVQRGGIRVHNRVTERPVEKDVELRSERVVVERRPVDRPLGADADRAFQERSIEVTERSEQPVVSKTARVVEEVVVGKQVEQHTQTVRDSERRTDVEVEKLNPDQVGSLQSGGGGGSAFDADTFAGEFARNDRYRGRDWTAVESDARRSFEQRYPQGKWEQFKDSIRSGYDRLRAKV